MNEEDKIDAIMATFRCTRDAASVVASVFSPQDVPAKRVIASQGAPASACWIVIDGAIRVNALGLEGQIQQLAQYGPGEFFGSFPEPSTHRAEISAATRTLLLRAEAAQLASVIKTRADLANGMARLLARQLDRALDRMVMRATCSAAGRVYAELMALAGPANTISPQPRVTQIALAANTTRETASRAIAVLIRRGIVSRDDDKLVIHSPRMVHEMIV
ncbi:Crp/Fnr family transcriptional regulator [Novosphingobium sp. 1949]|uniref:Crp/Fnr family transcriptional regulator n=1 Tax=Novosphingobium organovorum TaxID=2930092 RepID=A0ABT0BAE6_9SPHN|nr:Crp/Fnr family transcriptional regulator [Novosphingobium organovorum]MCJ2181914.1 Crp/Fnr family transcriptional regulator [Novosphingobium organovorum]